ncbi:MAG: GNAT family N-acetyltransferase [Gammaproteobacteria bacterium]|nr:MAG: GNAT family N-acetyltransferase [Gammaproteobacteria bacterium]
MATIREATVKDVAVIHQFIQELADYEQLSDEVTATISQLENTLFGETSVAHVLIAEQDNEPVGFALYFFNYSTFLAKPGIYLEDLYVRPKFRGRGVGTALLKKLAAIANERGCGRLEWSVLKWNKPAIDFYEKIGARPMDEWVTYRLAGKALSSFGAIRND